MARTVALGIGGAIERWGEVGRVSKNQLDVRLGSLRVCAQRNEGIAGLWADGRQSRLGCLKDDAGHRVIVQVPAHPGCVDGDADAKGPQMGCRADSRDQQARA